MMCSDAVRIVVEATVKQPLLWSDHGTSALVSLTEEFAEQTEPEMCIFLQSLEMLENSQRTIAMLVSYWYRKAVNRPVGCT